MTRAYVTRKLVLRRDLYGAFLRLRRHEVARRGRGKEREREREIEREALDLGTVLRVRYHSHTRE